METVDLRGSQKGIFRMYGFDKLGLLHMIFYRVLILAALVASVLIAYYALSQNATVLIYVQVMILAVWILFTPQLFSVAKVFSVVSTKGVVFGKLNASFLETLQQRPVYKLFRAIPYAALALWFIFLILLIWLWF